MKVKYKVLLRTEAVAKTYGASSNQNVISYQFLILTKNFSSELKISR